MSGLTEKVALNAWLMVPGSTTKSPSDDWFSQLYQFNRLVNRTLVNALTNQGHSTVGSSQLVILRQIKDGITNIELVHRLSMTKQAVSCLLQRLRADGYIAGLPSENDHRVTLLFLTDRGRQVVEIANDCLHQLWQQLDYPLF